MGSPFASRVVDTIPVPFDPPHTVTVGKLTGWQLQKAELAAQRKFMESIEERGGVEAQKRMLAMFERPKDAPEPEPKKDEPVDPMTGLDPYTLCRYGIKAWSYDESLEPDSETGRIAALEDMGADDLEWFAEQVLRRTKPRLFQTKAEHEDAEKNA